MEQIRASQATPGALLALVAHHTPLWLDVDARKPAEHALLRDVFGFHPLTIEDSLNRHTRVKVEPYDGYLFIVVRAMRLDADVPLHPRSLDVSKLCIFLGENFIVSVHTGHSEAIAAAERAAHDDCDRVAHAICDAAVDAYFPILDRVDAYVDRLERSNLSAVDSRGFSEMANLRRLAFAAHRSLTPQRAIFDELAHQPSPYLSAEAQRYFRDVFDHTERICDSLDAYREIMAMTTESSVAHLSARLEYATTIFSAVATVALPFVVISGLFGMNFTHMPLVTRPDGFWFAAAAQVVLSITLLTFFRRRHLL